MTAVAGKYVTQASADFMNALVALELGTEDSGIHATKPGYHGTRDENIEMDRHDSTSVADYSIRATLDKAGPSDKASAYDWTHKAAQSGDYRSMKKYGDRIKAAFIARDPRLYGWREALGQTDLDATAEGLDFDSWTLRTPDSSHAWHWHFSEHRAFVDSWDNKLAFLSVLKGESLADYLAKGGKLLKPNSTQDWMDKLVKTQLPLLRRGDNNWSVGLWQRVLVHHGLYSNDKVDNDFGPLTEAASTALGKRYGAEGDPTKIGPEMWTIGLTRQDQV